MVSLAPCKKVGKNVPSYNECMAFIEVLIKKEKERGPIVVPDGYTLASWASYKLDEMRDRARIRSEIDEARLEARIDELLAAGKLREPGVKCEIEKESPNRTEIFLNEENEDEYCVRAVQWVKARNLDDPRNKHRIKCVIGFLWGKFKGASELLVRAIGADELRSENVFGQGKEIRVLKDALLIKTGNWVAGKKFNRYKLNVPELNELLACLNWSGAECMEYFIAQRIDYFEDKYWDELKTGEFKYFRSKKKMSSRIYHEIINESKFVRNRLMKKHGYRWQYDLKSAFPTLAFQMMRAFKPRFELPCFSQLVNAPDEMRQFIARHLDVSVPQVKVILSSLLFGAKLSSARNEAVLNKCVIYEELDYNLVKWDKLRAMPWIKKFMREIEDVKLFLWDCFDENKHAPSPFAGATGYKRLYFACEQLEAYVRELMSSFIQAKGGRVLKIHDCVVSDLDLDVNELVEWVAEQSKGVFEIKLSKDEY